jgi:hypothetical protein
MEKKKSSEVTRLRVSSTFPPFDFPYGVVRVESLWDLTFAPFGVERKNPYGERVDEKEENSRFLRESNSLFL